MHTDEHRKNPLVTFLEFPRTCGRKKVFLIDLTFSLAKVLQALINIYSLICIRKMPITF